MAGSISLSLSQQFDSDGRPLSGGLLYFYQAGTSTPQSAYQDSGLTIAYPNPITLDASGRVPSFFLADGNIKIRLTDSTGVTVIAADNLLVVGASSGSGGSVAVDATTILATGDIKARFGEGTLSGFARCNGRTIGSATSGATERANADCQALFEYLWNTVGDSILAVSGGRGGSATSDFSANKAIILPDLRGRTISGLDDMGASAAGRLSSTGLGASATQLGNAGGAQTFTLATANLPAHTHSTAVTFSATTDGASTGHTHSVSMTSTGTAASSGAHTHTVSPNLVSASSGSAGGGNLLGSTASQTTSSDGAHTHTVSVSGSATSADMSNDHTHHIALSGTFASTSVGSTTPMSVMQPTMVMTFYMKL